MEDGQVFTEVVCGLLVRDHHLLVALRHPGGDLGAVWEFPGGKVEAGESHVAALIRESSEELGVAVEVGALAWDLVWPRPSKTSLRLWFYFTRMTNPDEEPRALAAQQLAWVKVNELGALPFCQGDMPMIAALQSGTMALPS